MNILVTGGSKGIGRAICLAFAEPGAHVFVNYAHDEEAAEETAAAIAAKGAEAHLVRGDVGSVAGAESVAAAVSATVDRLDVLVHGAVRPYSAPLLDIPDEELVASIEVNATALVRLVRSTRSLLGRGSSIVFLSSRGAKAVVPQYAAVGAPKAMAEALVRYLAVELAPDGIRANTVTASALLTDAFRAAVPDPERRFASLAAAIPLGRTLEVDDVADAVRFLSSPAASMITGTELVVDGGLYSKA